MTNATPWSRADRLHLMSKHQHPNGTPVAKDSSAAQLRLQTILDAAVDAIITIDSQGIIESANTTTEHMFGYSESELIGRNVSVLMPSPDRELHDSYIQRYLATDVPHIIGIGREVTALHRDGHTFPADLAVNVFVLNDKTMFTGMIRNISDRHAAERKAQLHLDALAHAGRLADLGLTTSTIAHEVNQPLTAIVSYAHACLRLLENEPAKNDRVYQALKDIANQGDRASSIVNRIHAMSRRQHSNFEPLRINDIIKGVLNLLASEIRSHHVHLDLHLMASPTKINADRIQIEQVLVNLVRNGIQAMSGVPVPNRRLDIKSFIDGERTCVQVHDNGPGLDETTALQIFESFYSTKDSGMGMGLSISRSLIEAHEGQLWAIADSGKGATFCFELPTSS